MRLMYVTKQLPWARDETFILTELREVLARGHDVLVVPVKPRLGDTFPDGADFRSHACGLPLFSPRYMASLGRWAIRRPHAIAGIVWDIARHSGNAKETMKNLAVLPKATVVASLLQDRAVDHLHAHWAGPPSSMALFAARLAGVRWSLTTHRGDIVARNLLVKKVEDAAFTRVISNDGRRLLAERVPPSIVAPKLHQLHMGVELPAQPAQRDYSRSHARSIVVPARLTEIKGHRYLFQALAIIRDRHGPALKCFVIGDGELQSELETYCRHLGLQDVAEFLGREPHEHLLQRYASGEVDAVVLPSVDLGGGAHEGIPVSLMEAMAHGIPVISTSTGGIPELVEGAGILVPPRDSGALAEAICRLLSSESYARTVARACRERIEARFSVGVAVTELEQLWRVHLPTTRSTPGDGCSPRLDHAN
jgi:colanic acid/amylovoran biosynthesis glycosyltransferase